MFCLRIDNLIFQGRAARVDHQNIHPCIISFCVIFHQAPLGLDTFLSILYYWNQRPLSMTCANIYDFFAILSYHICYNKQMPPIAFLLLCVICLPRVFPVFPARSAQISRPASNSPQKPEPQPAPFCPFPNPQKIRDTARRAARLRRAWRGFVPPTAAAPPALRAFSRPTHPLCGGKAPSLL